MNKGNYGVQILLTKYYSLKEKQMTANEEMIHNPNEYSAKVHEEMTKLMKEVAECLNVLNITA